MPKNKKAKKDKRKNNPSTTDDKNIKEVDKEQTSQDVLVEETIQSEEVTKDIAGENSEADVHGSNTEDVVKDIVIEDEQVQNEKNAQGEENTQALDNEQTQAPSNEKKPLSKGKKIAIAVIAIAAAIGAGCGAKYKYDEDTNVLELKVSEALPVQIKEKKAKNFKAKDLVKSCTGDLTISGKLDSQKYTKQTIDFTYTKGWSTKHKTIKVLVSKANEQPKIKLKNTLVNVQVGDSSFKLSDVVDSIKADDGQKISYKSKTKVYKKIQKEKKNIAYFQGTDGLDVNTVGYYIVHLYAFDSQGMHTKATFVVNVTKDKEKADKKIEDIKNNVLDTSTITNSSNVEVSNETVNDSSSSNNTSNSTTSSTSQTASNSTSSTAEKKTDTSSSTTDTSKKEDKTDGSNKDSGKMDSKTEPACEPTVVDNKTTFDDYTKAIEAAKANGNNIETQEDACGNTIYVLV